MVGERLVQRVSCGMKTCVYDHSIFCTLFTYGSTSTSNITVVYVVNNSNVLLLNEELEKRNNALDN